MSSKRKSPPNKLSNAGSPPSPGSGLPASSVQIEKNNYKNTISLKHADLLKSSPVKELDTEFDTSFLSIQKMQSQLEPKYVKNEHSEYMMSHHHHHHHPYAQQHHHPAFGGMGGGMPHPSLMGMDGDFQQFNLPFLNVASYILKGSDPAMGKNDNYQLTMNLDNLNISNSQAEQQQQQQHQQQQAAPRKVNNLILNHLKTIVDNFDSLNNNVNDKNTASPPPMPVPPQHPTNSMTVPPKEAGSPIGGGAEPIMNNHNSDKNNYEGFRSRLDERISNLQLSKREINLMRLNLSLLDFPNEIPPSLLNNHHHNNSSYERSSPHHNQGDGDPNCSSSQNNMNIKLIKRSFKESLYEKEKNINRLIMYFTIWREMLLKAEFVRRQRRCGECPTKKAENALRRRDTTNNDTIISGNINGALVGCVHTQGGVLFSKKLDTAQNEYGFLVLDEGHTDFGVTEQIAEIVNLGQF